MKPTEQRESKSLKKYPEVFKYEVVNRVLKEGLSLEEASRKYGIKGHMTIKRWLLRYGKGKYKPVERMNNKETTKELEKLKKEKAELESALLRSSIKINCLEKIIEAAEDHYGEDFKKNIT